MAENRKFLRGIDSDVGKDLTSNFPRAIDFYLYLWLGCGGVNPVK